jgi:hypothetical protein
MDVDSIRKLGISSSLGDKETVALFEKLIAYGWIDGAGRSLPWTAHLRRKDRAAAAGRE